MPFFLPGRVPVPLSEFADKFWLFMVQQMSQIQFDAQDELLRSICMEARDALVGPRDGDFVRFPCGTLERVVWIRDVSETIQTVLPGGAFFIDSGGGTAYSGIYNPRIRTNSLKATSEVRDGKFWFFHHGEVRAGGGVDFLLPCRVFETTAEFKGFRPTVCACCGEASLP